MKVPYGKIETGIASYIDKEIFPKLQLDDVKRYIGGIGVSLFIKAKSKQLYAFVTSQTSKDAGIIDEEGLIDLDLLKEVFTNQMPEKGIRIQNNLIPDEIDGITLDKSDIESLYDYISKMA